MNIVQMENISTRILLNVEVAKDLAMDTELTSLFALNVHTAK